MHSTAFDMSCPALCPGHAALLCIPLGRWPSLHLLRPKLPRFVRRLHRYYAIVRLPVFVHHRRASLDFPMRPTSWANTGSPGSRARCVRACAGSSTARSLCHACDNVCHSVAFRCVPPRRRSVPGLSRLNTRPARAPINASPERLLVPVHDWGSVWFATP